MKVKMLANQVFLGNLRKRKLEERFDHSNPERYGKFSEIFGKKEFGFILAGDLKKEIETGTPTKVYHFGKNLYPIHSSEGVECELFLPSSFSPQPGILPSVENVEKTMEYLEKMKNEGKIKHIINSKKGTLSEDKTSIFELEEKGFPIPPTFQFKTYEELNKFMGENPGEYIVKHRYGHGGKDLYKINSKDTKPIKGINLENFIVQKKVEILNEKRIIFFEDEFLGARIIYDRHMPWEKEGQAERKHITEEYIPTKEELENTWKIMKEFDATVGCIDWIETKDKGNLFLEYNGFGTGYGKGPHPYNLNEKVATKLKEKFL
jgi:glutathione synthase/RimK-type ligase-like ATP-grasp enzyme